MARKSEREQIGDHPSVLPDELDDALEALWHGDSGKLDHLLGTNVGDAQDESTIARMVRAAAELHSNSETIIPPRDIDEFTIEGEIGRGGMGVVYRARQKHPERTVAIKLIRPGKLTAEHRRRFQYEADVLASLSHPGIATIHQAGIYEIDGQSQPYIVMELVNGKPLTAFAKCHQLVTRNRLELFLSVCDAVHYAHQRGVIHRDLKPENILAVPGVKFGSPTIKLLDFGVARPIDAASRSDRPETTDSSFIGTMLYMSPEQVDGETLDARSDVYSLGVVLYELLLEHLPYEFASPSPSKVMEAIREQAPRFGDDDRLENDLVLILQTAMAKVRAQRFASADALAADVKRYLRYEPIAARPPSAAYQFRKFAQRNPFVIAGMSAFAILIVTAFIVITWLYVEAQAAKEAEADQRRLAEREVEKQEAVREFLHDMLAVADPRIGTGNPDITVREVVDHAAQSLDAGDRQYDPEIEALVRDMIADVYVAFALFDDAEELFLSAQQLREANLPADHPDHALTKLNLGSLYYRTGNLDHAQPLLEEALNRLMVTDGEVSDAVATTVNNLALVIIARGEYERAYGMFQRVLDIRREALEPDHPLIGQAMNNLAMTLHYLGRYDEAEKKYQDSLTFRERIFGDSHPEVAETLSNLAILKEQRGALDEAEADLRRSITIVRDAFGERNPAVQNPLNNLATLMYAREQFEDAAELMHEVLEIAQHNYDPTHPSVITTQNNLAVIYSRLDRLDEAEAIMREVLEVRQATLFEDHPDIAIGRSTLGQLLQRRGHFEEAEHHLTAALGARRNALGEAHPNTLFSIGVLADLYLELERYEDAETLLLTARDHLDSDENVSAQSALSIYDALIELYESWGRDDIAAHVKQQRAALGIEQID